MNTAHFVALIFRKDLRTCRLALIFAAGFGVAYPLLFDSTTTLLWNGYSTVAALLAYILAYFTALVVMQMDSPADSMRFLATRPVPGSAVLLAKALFLGLFFVLGGWILVEFDYAVVGLPLSLADHLSLFLSSIVNATAIMAGVVLLSLFFKSAPYILLGNIGLLVALVFLGRLETIFFPGRATILPDSAGAGALRDAWLGTLHEIGFIAAVGVAAWARCCAKWQTRPLLILVVALGAALYGIFGVLDSILPVTPRVDTLPSGLRERLHFSDFQYLGGGAFSSWGPFTSHTISCNPTLEGIDAPYYATLVGTQATAILRSGQIIPSVASENARNFSFPLSIPFKAAVIGVSIPKNFSFSRTPFILPAFSYLSWKLPANQDLTGVTISGMAQLEIHRAYVAGSVPFKKGATFSANRQRFELTDFSSYHGAIDVGVRGVMLPIGLRGDSDTLGFPDRPWALVSRSRNEMAANESGNSGSSAGFPIVTATWGVTFSDTFQPFPPDWTEGAEVVFFGDEDCGRVTIPYHLDNVALIR